MREVTADVGAFEMFERPDLEEIRPAQLEPLERLLPLDWPEFWRELATSLFVTLICAPGAGGALHADALARLAMALTLGVVQDMGGSQPYIPVGSLLAASARSRLAMELRARGVSYKEAAAVTGVTEARIRKIEAQWRREQMALRQGRLPLE